MIEPGTAMIGSALIGGFGNLLFGGGGNSEAQMEQISRAISQLEGVVPPDLAKSIVYTA